MVNCIFTAHCTETVCDKSCPILVETSYLLERNGLNMTNPVFYKYPGLIPEACKILDLPHNAVITLQFGDLGTSVTADLITYCAICRNWRGSQLHCTVYHLKYSKYIDELKKSWNSAVGESESLQYMKIWSETAKVLVISNFDYVKFGDFESQTMLALIQQRSNNGLKTIVVSPPSKDIVTSNDNGFSKFIKLNASNASNEDSKDYRVWR